jgi:hypothetical protein
MSTTACGMPSTSAANLAVGPLSQLSARELLALLTGQLPNR